MSDNAARPNAVDDDWLLDAADYFDAEEAMPGHLVTMASELFTWHRMDAELLELLADSFETPTTAVRASATDRILVFGSQDRGLHLSCVAEGEQIVIDGQLVPGGRYRIDVERPSYAASTETDDMGSFRTSPLGLGRIRLVARIMDGTDAILTPWFDLG